MFISIIVDLKMALANSLSSKLTGVSANFVSFLSRSLITIMRPNYLYSILFEIAILQKVTNKEFLDKKRFQTATTALNYKRLPL